MRMNQFKGKKVTSLTYRCDNDIDTFNIELFIRIEEVRKEIGRRFKRKDVNWLTNEFFGEMILAFYEDRILDDFIDRMKENLSIRDEKKKM